VLSPLRAQIARERGVCAAIARWSMSSGNSALGRGVAGEEAEAEADEVAEVRLRPTRAVAEAIGGFVVERRPVFALGWLAPPGAKEPSSSFALRTNRC
jgi:hypothetical protein